MTAAFRRSVLLVAALTPGIAAAQAPSPPQTPIDNSSAALTLANASGSIPPKVRFNPRLSDDNLMLYEVSLDQLSLTDSIATYATADGPLIPLGELSRLLDVDIMVSPAEGRITGTVGEARQPVLVDSASGLVRLNGETTRLVLEDIAIGQTDIYVRPSLLERILPVKITIDDRGLRIVVKALQPMPIQSRLDRLGRLRELQSNIGDRTEVLRVSSPYRFLSIPSFDVSLATASATRAPKFPKRYDVRAGADVLFTGFQGYLGSDDKGRPATARALFERRDPNGLFGPLDITRASAGDVFTPTLAIGPRSVGGRGVSFTTAALAQASVFDRIDLRGELPIGYDVELYVNDVLRSGQQTPVQGRYEFLNVALVRGINVIRLVSHGPRGERSEEKRVINVGAGQLAKGKLAVDFGAIQQDRNLFELPNRRESDIAEPGRGRVRLVANLAYGLTNSVTLIGGASLYSPIEERESERELMSLGLRTSIRSIAVQVDGAYDSTGGGGLAIGLSGHPFGIAAILRHSEYRGGFIDETTPTGGAGRALIRYSEATFDLSVRPFGKLAFPLTASVQRNQYANGDTGVRGTVRTSAVFGRALVSAGLDYDRVTARDIGSRNNLSGNVSASTYAAFNWQLRASVDYTLLPWTRVRAAAVTADRNIGKNMAIRLGLGRSFEADRASTLQASTILRLSLGDLSLGGDYELRHHDWRIGLAFAFSLAFDPLSHRYAVKRIGAGSGGNLALQAFVDKNGNDRLDPGEEPVSGVAINGGFSQSVTTDGRGQALVTGLGYGAVAQVRTNIDNVDLPYVTTPPSTIEFTPRAGRATVVMYPLKPEGEVLARLKLRQPGGKLVGLSAVRVDVTPCGGTAIHGVTEYDGSVVFERLKAGTYHLELDNGQAKRLKMRLVTPLMFVVPPNGGSISDVNGEVAFDDDAQ